jgi:hypothetical protein
MTPLKPMRAGLEMKMKRETKTNPTMYEKRFGICDSLGDGI